MKVRTGFAFTDEELRTIRAAINRGGKATRKEALVFIDRAVRDAMKDAPAPKPVRKRAAKPEPTITPKETPEQERERLRRQRDRIAKFYGHQTGGAA